MLQIHLKDAPPFRYSYATAVAPREGGGMTILAGPPDRRYAIGVLPLADVERITAPADDAGLADGLREFAARSGDGPLRLTASEADGTVTVSPQAPEAAPHTESAADAPAVDAATPPAP